MRLLRLLRRDPAELEDQLGRDRAPGYILPTTLTLLETPPYGFDQFYQSETTSDGTSVQMGCSASLGGYVLSAYLQVVGWPGDPINAASASCTPYESVFRYPAQLGVSAFTIRITE